MAVVLLSLTLTELERDEIKMAAEFLTALRPLFDCLADGICITDVGGRLLYANDAAGRLLGPGADEAVTAALCGPLCGKIQGASCDKEAADCPMKSRPESASAVTFRGKHADSGNALRVRCLKVRLPSAELRFVIIEDDTAEADLARHREDSRQMIAHDVRAPLTIAAGALRILDEMGAGHTLSEKDIELVQNGIRNCSRIELLIEAYLETERLMEGSMPIHPAAVDVARLIRELVDEHATIAVDGSRRPALTGDASKGLIARADPELLRRALANLIGNALKFTPPGGRIVVDAAGGDGSVRIRVADSGPGIPASDLPRIFERYYQGANGERGHGLGLGLTFCRAALRAMGGEISVESKEGKGSVFTLELPKETAGSPS